MDFGKIVQGFFQGEALEYVRLKSSQLALLIVGPRTCVGTSLSSFDMLFDNWTLCKVSKR